MRFSTGAQARGSCLLLLVYAVGKVAGTNFTQCLIDLVANATTSQNLTGLLNGDGDPVSNASDATAISYSLCTSVCGTRPQDLWAAFSEDFGSWLLPYLALISQLPFGAQYRLDNFMSAVLTVGSPALAGYSLFITILNSRWINRRFTQSVDYPNSRFAISILASLQQVPLRLQFDREHFPSLVVLPENDIWWKYFSELVDYSHTWSIATATSIAWVIVASILTVADSPWNSYVSYQAVGEGTGTMWLWLLPIVIGWLQLSPKCDFDRLQSAYERADRYTRGAASYNHLGTSPTSTRRALTITAQEDVMSPDELLTPPVFNYSRSLQWASTANTIFLVFKVASEKAQNRIPVQIGSDWVESDTPKDIHPSNRRGFPQEIIEYCAQPVDVQRSHWAPGVFTKMAVASCASLGLGCRSLTYIIYGVVSTVIWMMLLVSSILAHYSAAYSRRVSLPARVALALSHWLRWMAKLLAIVNSMWAVALCAIAYSNVFNTCFCNSSMFSRGKGAYNVLRETTAQVALVKATWIISLVMASVSVLFFLGLVNLLLDNLPS
ncbi:hypothetical protein K503DRAFT_851829 [Rhizopogon vinicolor AM-OR11-026]|uniref:TRP C-terminal domain-containing protein n=1 Tax=Rhizopogon vinicolor AM-OR11-026 TaxID=1314800 RepID=A0A1B7MMA8_9AGAM|nr:hypothetical protein K503DRAFT_851829 [Rhizopogon vinicolor AM-OR11-026]